jgi:NTE family protein
MMCSPTRGPATEPLQALRSSPLFADAPDDVLTSLRPYCRRVDLRGGATLFEQHDPGDAYYVLLRGRLAVFHRDEAGAERRLADVTAGQGVGELALLFDEPRAASVRAVRDSDLIALDRTGFLDLVQRAPDVGVRVMRTLVERLRTPVDSGSVASPVAIVVVVALDDHAAAAHVAGALADTLAGVTSCCLATAADLASARALDELESRYGTVVLTPDPQDTSAVRWATSQADVVLFVADGSADAPTRERAAGRARGLGLGRWVRRQLVLRWETEHPVAGAARPWADAVSAEGVSHLRRGVPGDLVRLARRLTGDEVGVVLSGGGARGFAHLGVLRALDEAGIAIGRIGGASMGAMVGALRAMELSPSEQLAVCRRVFVDGRPLRDHTYPEVAFVRGRRLQELTRSALGERDIEDLPVPFFSVASSLTTAEVRIDETGSLWRAVRASGSVPGYGPPMYREGESLVDGGVLANLPVDAMRARTAGHVVAVDVSREDFPSVAGELDDATPSGWELRRRRRGGEAVPNLGRILYRVSTLAGAAATRRGRLAADLVVTPPAAEIGALEFARLDELADLGYRAARDQLGASSLELAPLRATPPGRAAREQLRSW